MRHAVIGSNGFIGAHLTRRLLADGVDVQVVLGSGDRWRLDRLGLAPRVVSFDELKWSTFDIVTVAAGFGTPAAVGDESLAGMGRELDLHRQVLRAVVDADHAPMINVLGSRTQYGELGVQRVSESMRGDPASPYALEKRMIDDLYALAAQQCGVPSVRFRVTNPYGPLEWTPGRRHGLVSMFLAQLLSDGVVRLFDGGEEVRDYLWIDDLVELLAQPRERRDDSIAVNAGSGEGTTIAEMARLLVDRLADVVDHELEILCVDAPDAAAKVATGGFVAAIDVARREFGWTPRTSLERGIDELVRAEVPRIQALLEAQ